MTISRDAILAALDTVVDSHLPNGLVQSGVVKAIELGSVPKIEIELGFPAQGFRWKLADMIRTAVRQATGEECEVQIGWKIISHTVQAKLQPFPEIKNIIAVASGKGGVGKSTVAVNLALALQAEGAVVGILDADIFGPSQPRMLGVANERPTSPDGQRMHPILAHGLQVMSIGFLIPESEPMIWRGPMVTQALAQLLNETVWRGLDYLVIDLPPGTGDVQLSLSQKVPVSGAVIVTTPQDIALLDAEKGLHMFRKVQVPVLGIVENMAVYCCPNCGHSEHIFSTGGADRLANGYDTEVLGQLPLAAKLREQGDLGTPTVIADPDGEVTRRYRAIARLATARLAHGAQEAAFPTIEIAE